MTEAGACTSPSASVACRRYLTSRSGRGSSRGTPPVFELTMAGGMLGRTFECVLAIYASKIHLFEPQSEETML